MTLAKPGSGSQSRMDDKAHFKSRVIRDRATFAEEELGSSDVSDPAMVAAVETLLRGIGEDPQREGLRKTPQRVVAALKFLTSGYRQSLEELLNSAIFDEGHDEMVLLRDVSLLACASTICCPLSAKPMWPTSPSKRWWA
jgi:GTP cyclohydrolase I